MLHNHHLSEYINFSFLHPRAKALHILIFQTSSLVNDR